MFKRLLDVGGSGLLLVLLSPLLAVVALAVRVKLGAPVIFRQQRPGQGGRPFTILKFRTMTDERNVSGELLPNNLRLIPFGRRLRTTSLDELPELLNVLRGDMSLVGPRPLRMEYLAHYTSEQMRRHEVRPGITGLAQVSGRNNLPWVERFELDVWYADNRSLWLDLWIMLKTAGVLLRGRGVHTWDGNIVAPFEGTRHNIASSAPATPSVGE